MHQPQHVVVLGAGVAGVTAALSLAKRGVQVTLLEREAGLGGNALTVCCKAIDGVCQLCGACLLADQIADAQRQPRIEIRTNTQVTAVARRNGDIWLTLSHGSGDRSLSADAVILATGFDHVDAHTKGPYGYGILPAVVTGEDMERRLKAQGQTAFDDLAPQRIAFIQCVGSRDEHSGRGYCSQVCCRYGVRLARLLKSRFPDAEITVFKMDIQTSGRDFAATWEAADREGIRFVSGLPAVVRRSPTDPRKVQFTYDDTLAGDINSEEFDLVVLSVGMQPRRDAPDVADLFGINLGEYGFFGTKRDGTGTIAEGVYVAGSCAAPRSIAESIAHAKVAAEACYLYLQEKGV